MSHNRRSILLSAMFAMVAALFAVPSASSSLYAKGKDTTKIEGTLVSVNANTGRLVIRLRNGQATTVTVPATAKVERNDLHATLRAFKVGDRVQVRFAGDIVIKAEATGA